jgi:hypothetical protein
VICCSCGEWIRGPLHDYVTTVEAECRQCADSLDSAIRHAREEIAGSYWEDE